jgi:hypothetical protein
MEPEDTGERMHKAPSGRASGGRGYRAHTNVSLFSCQRHPRGASHEKLVPLMVTLDGDPSEGPERVERGVRHTDPLVSTL